MPPWTSTPSQANKTRKVCSRPDTATVRRAILGVRTARRARGGCAERDKDAINKAGGHLGIAELKTDPKVGLCGTELSEESLARRKEAFGVNEFEYPPPKSFLQLCRDALDDLTVQILCVAAIISLGIGAGLPKHREEYGYLEGIAIVIVVFVVFLQAYIDYVKEQKFRQLNGIKDNYAVKVIPQR